MRLYVDSHYLSPYAMSTFVALQEKALPFQVIPLDLAAGAHREHGFARASITQRVPTLVDGDFSLSESSAIDEYLANNARYAEGFSGPLPMPPSSQIAVVACMDARLNVYALLGLSDGEAHVIRNAGGVITDDEIRSLAISQRLLGTREIMLIHHTDCGMLTFTDDAFKRSIQDETGIKPPWSAESFPDLDVDVRQSMARIKASPFIPHKDAIRGFVFDVATGKLNEVV